MTDIPKTWDAFVDGRWVATDERFEVRDPFDNALVSEVTESDDALIDRACEAAERAFAPWRATPAPARGKILRRISDDMLADEANLAALCTAENGKAIKESRAEVRYAASFFAWFAGEAERTYGEIIPATLPNQMLLVTREPVGPCALITPWNFPYAMLARKMAAALAAGCTIVAKPAEQTPMCALAIANICEAFVPAGVVNVVPSSDGARAGARLVNHRAIKKVGFTGSTEVGKLLMRGAADDLKRVSLELGGNAPFVVLADADLDAAVEGALVAKFRNAGQTCVAANRFILEAPIALTFGAKLSAAIGKLVVGRGGDPTVDVGPLIDLASAKKCARLVADALGKGATILFGAPPVGDTTLVAPVVIAGVTRDMAMWREEIFGPIVALATARDEADAIAMANDTEMGLVAYVYSRGRGMQMAAALEAGMVGVNEGLVSTAQAPFGGIKQSGVGREGSRHGLDDYTSYKYIAMRVG